jgi:hypothetical protein
MGRIIGLGSDPQLVRAITVSGTNGQVLPNNTVLAQGLEFTALMERILISEIPATYAQPGAGLSGLLGGPVEVGTTVSSVLTPAFTIGDAGALTSYALQRGATVLASSATAPITYPAYTESYVLPLGTTSWTATFNYAAGPIKQGNQGTNSPGNIPAGSRAASQGINAQFKGYFGYAGSNGVKTVAQLIALGNGALQTGKSRSLSGVTAGVGNYTIYAWPSTGSDNITSVLLGPEEVRGAFGAVAYATGPNALGATVTMGYIISNAANAFTSASLAFS